MRTKILVLSAVLGAVGAATVSAQVYSVNAVGYVNSTVCPGFNLLANPLDNKTGNNIENLFPTPPAGLAVFLYRNNAYVDSTFDPDFGGWSTPGLVLAPGEGFWLAWPNAASGTITFVGDVPQGNLVNQLPAGFSMRGSMVPQAGKLVTDLLFPAAAGDTVYQYKYDAACKGGYVDNTFDPDFGGWSAGAEPNLAVGEGFWVAKVAATQWVRDFSVK